MITLQDSEQPFICEICRLDYDGNVAMPLVICKNFHVVCNNCLQRLTNQSDSFRCPFCRMTCGWRRAIQFKFLLEVKAKLMRMTRQQEELRSKNMELEARNNILRAETHQLLLSLSVRDVHYRLSQKSRYTWGSQQERHRNLEERIQVLDSWRTTFMEQVNNIANINQYLLRQLKNKNQKIGNLQNSISALQQQYNKKFQSAEDDRKTAIKSMRKHYRQRIRQLQKQAGQASRLRMLNQQLEEAVRLTHHEPDVSQQPEHQEKTMNIRDFMRLGGPVKVTIDMRQFRRIQSEPDMNDSEM